MASSRVAGQSVWGVVDDSTRAGIVRGRTGIAVGSDRPAPGILTLAWAREPAVDRASFRGRRPHDPAREGDPMRRFSATLGFVAMLTGSSAPLAHGYVGGPTRNVTDLAPTCAGCHSS